MGNGCDYKCVVNYKYTKINNYYYIKCVPIYILIK